MSHPLTINLPLYADGDPKAGLPVMPGDTVHYFERNNYSGFLTPRRGDVAYLIDGRPLLDEIPSPQVWDPFLGNDGEWCPIYGPFFSTHEAGLDWRRSNRSGR